jgi:hypothetical protein
MLKHDYYVRVVTCRHLCGDGIILWLVITTLTKLHNYRTRTSRNVQVGK